MRPRSTAARRCASRSTSSSPSARRPVITVVACSPSSGPSGPSGTSGSRNGTSRWTGPAGPASAVATARAATERTWRAVTSAPSRSGSSANHFTCDPNRRTWSIAWAAPRSRSSAGRSAVRRMSGTRPSDASTAAGRRFAAAVPEVVRTATGRRPAFAMPRAKKPALRSSSRTRTVIPGWARRARASGVDRDPGQTTASPTPARTSASTKPRTATRSVIGRRPPGAPPPRRRGAA